MARKHIFFYHIIFSISVRHLPLSCLQQFHCIMFIQPPIGIYLKYTFILGVINDHVIGAWS